MPAPLITVRGSFEASYPPERGTLHLTISHDGADKAAVYASTTQTADEVATALAARTDAAFGPVTAWSTDRLRTWSDRPWDEHGERKDLTYHASVDVEATFIDFDALADFVDDVNAWSGAAVDGIDWTLLEAHHERVQREARSQAVLDAVQRATDYAVALGLASVDVVALADVGMLGGEVSYNRAEQVMRQSRTLSRKADAMSNIPFALNPQDVAVSAAVDARFTAS